MNRFMKLGAVLALALLSASAAAATLSVGPGKTYPAPCAAFAAAKDGDTIEIEGNTTYIGDLCVIVRNGLTIRGVNGRPVIDANGKTAKEKGIWVVDGNDITVENVEMFGAASTSGNGAALRLEARNFTLRGAFLHDNQNGILSNSVPDSNILIENSEFGHNGLGDGQTHNLYIGRSKTLTFRYNFSHDANVGHNLKSRAETNIITYNRFSSLNLGELGSTVPGRPSYEIDLPNAGTSYVIGNVIHQPAGNENNAMLAYGAEGPAAGVGQDLYVVNNTLVNDAPGGAVFLFVSGRVSTPALAQNNLFVGAGTLTNNPALIQKTNARVSPSVFVNRAVFDLRVAPGAADVIDAGSEPGTAPSGFALAPVAQYRAPAGGEARPRVGALDIGAYETTSTTPTVIASVASWTPCAKEGATCAFAGTREVRYGAGPVFVTRTATSAIACGNDAFGGDPTPGVAKACSYASTDLPSAAASTLPTTPAVSPVEGTVVPAWAICIYENGICNFWGTREVRFGAAGKFVTKVTKGPIKCDIATFGSDPIPNTFKSCSVSSAVPGAAPAPVTSTTPPGTAPVPSAAEALGRALSAILGRTVTVTIQ